MSGGVLIGGRYELHTTLGRGGFGAVWRGFDRTLARDVAVKMVAFDRLVDRDAATARFWREARAVAALNHPNIVTAHDFGVHDGHAYLVMELLAGGSLADEQARARELRSGRLSAARVRDIADQVCAGLDAAHRAGLVHRDLKPANIMTAGPGGPLKIVDFGIVWADRQSRLTRAGDHMGTLRYASPEQMATEDTVDGRADLYSLGCVLYELLTDRSPFVADLPAEWLSAHLSAAPVPLRDVAPEVPADLAELIGDLLAKEPAARPPSAAAVRARLAGRPATEAEREPVPVGTAVVSPDRAPAGTPGATGSPGAVLSPDRAPAGARSPGAVGAASAPGPARAAGRVAAPPGSGPRRPGMPPPAPPTMPPTRFDRLRPPVPLAAGARPGNGIATAGLVLGILPLPLLGLAFGIAGVVRSRRLLGVGRTRAIVGIVLALLWVIPVLGVTGAVLQALSRKLDPGCIDAGRYIQQASPRVDAEVKSGNLPALGIEMHTLAAQLRHDAQITKIPAAAADMRAIALDLDGVALSLHAGKPPPAGLWNDVTVKAQQLQADCR